MLRERGASWFGGGAPPGVACVAGGYGVRGLAAERGGGASFVGVLRRRAPARVLLPRGVPSPVGVGGYFACAGVARSLGGFVCLESRARRGVRAGSRVAGAAVLVVADGESGGAARASIAGAVRAVRELGVAGSVGGASHRRAAVAGAAGRVAVAVHAGRVAAAARVGADAAPGVDVGGAVAGEGGSRAPVDAAGGGGVVSVVHAGGGGRDARPVDAVGRASVARVRAVRASLSPASAVSRVVAHGDAVARAGRVVDVLWSGVGADERAHAAVQLVRGGCGGGQRVLAVARLVGGAGGVRGVPVALRRGRGERAGVAPCAQLVAAAVVGSLAAAVGAGVAVVALHLSGTFLGSPARGVFIKFLSSDRC